MPVEIRVVNQLPYETDVAPKPMLDFFRNYAGTDARPYTHQADVWEQHAAGRDTFIVAGTASGKTLATAVPLFYKLFRAPPAQRIRRALWMYPTIALLEDQRRVLTELAKSMGLDPQMIIGELRGGMSRRQLLATLNKPVILATPDEVYWFFRKNVKYSGLLIYGLALVDEFVLDEAHLFNGLMLRNLTHFKHRVELLGKRLGKHHRWHVLTATPTYGLRHLTEGVETRGKSKCGDVVVTFLEPVMGYTERRDRLVAAVESALVNGADKVLLVVNSADLAHRIFEEVKGKSQPELSADLEWRFGRISWGDFKVWLEEHHIEGETVEEIEQWLTQEGRFYLKDLAGGIQTAVPTELLAGRVTGLLEDQVWTLKHLAFSAAREEGHNLIEVIERKLGSKGRLTRLLWGAIRSRLKDQLGAGEVAEALDGWFGALQVALERVWVEDSLSITAPAFPEIMASLQEAGLGSEMASTLTDHLKYTVEIPEEAAAGLRLSPQGLANRQMAFSWLEWLVRDHFRREALVGQIQKALEDKRLEVKARNIAAWGDNAVPVVIYTGKMSRAERKGLIEAFEALPRAILISTPAVEVGVDFAVDTLITEQCDGNSFLQRFGRVGRRRNIQGKVVVLVRDGETYVRLHQRHRPQMTREEFSTFIADPIEGVFPARFYAEGSSFLDATHWLVNDQLGEIGDWLNQTMFGKEVAAFGRKLREANLPFAYGLRGTLPEVALRDGTGGGEPFYILRKVSNERLLPGDSLFEMARANMSYLEFLWKKPGWKAIVVDVQATLESSQALFWWQHGQWHLRAAYGIAADYVKLFSSEPVSKGQPVGVLLKALEKQIRYELEGFLSKIRSEASKPLPQLLVRIGEALPLFFEPYCRIILGQGDVHLLRVDPDGIADAVEDCLGNPLVLPDQTWLILYNYKREEAEERLKKVSALNLEEIIYDWNTLQVPGSLGPVLLDRVSGACFDVYRRLVEYADR